MNKEAIYHHTYSEYCFALSQNKVVIRLRTKKDDLKDCILYFGDRMDYHNPILTIEDKMKKKWSDELFDYYESVIDSPYTRICYYFRLIDEDGEIYYYNDTYHNVPDINRQLYYTFHYIRVEDIPYVPKWVQEAIIYQIYPDSFATSKNYISGKGNEIISETGSISRSMYGGTLKGITENMEYLKNLGITCIYMTPVFNSNSWHKYDTVDYFDMDPNLGTKDDLRDLIAASHEAGIKVVLDGVFNHCGPNFFAFEDVRKNGKLSKYYDWFYIKDYPLIEEGNPNYECFSYVGTMPKLNTGNPEVAKYLIDVGTYWVREFDIDGWRLDVANEVNMDFWREYRTAIRNIKADTYLVGEIWDDAKNFLQGDQFDATMNYNLYFACIDFFAKQTVTPREFDARVQYLLIRYKKQIQYAEMNLLGSHDVPRFLSLAGNDIRKLKLCALFIMTHVGAPMIYYGDEKGLSGLEEVEYRRPMDWDNEGDIFQYYRKIIQLRKKYMENMLGDYISLGADDYCIAYLRKSKHQNILIVINNSNLSVERKFSLHSNSHKIEDYITGNTYEIADNMVTIKLLEYEAAVIVY